MANGRSGGRGSAPSAGARGRSRQGASPRGGAKGGKRFGAEGFRRAAKVKTGMTLADFTKQIAEAKARQSAATTASAKAAAAKAVKAAEAAKKAYMTQTATAREKKRGGGESSARVATVTSRAGKAGTKQGQSRRGGMTGTGGKSPGPRGQRGGTPGRGAMSADRDRQGRSRGGPKGGRRGRGGRGGGGGGAGGGGGSGGCFVAETLVQMLDGTTKPIIDIQVGEHIKGGIVESKMKFLPTNIYNYKGVEVSGSHWVIEDNQFIEVENSKHGILTDKIETVYCFKTSENRIWVNDIEFGDYESGSQEDWEPYFKQVKEKLNRELLLKQ